MTWFWMNIPLAALFFLAWTLIPLWMVFRHPDTGISARDARPPSRAAAGARRHRRRRRARQRPTDFTDTDWLYGTDLR